MKIATWNVNSIRARQERLLAWLQKAQPDVVCLQELKATDDAFPYEAIRHAGYHAAVFGQKTYNGVAILSRDEPLNVQRGIPGFEDPQARLLLAKVNGISVISAYVPTTASRWNRRNTATSSSGSSNFGNSSKSGSSPRTR